MPDPVFTARDLSIAVPGRTLATDFNLDLQPGELVALTGPSGSGKTTLLRTLAGLIDAPRGVVQFQNQSPQHLGWPQFRRRVMLVPQQPVMIDGSVEDNLALPWSYGLSRREAFDPAQAAELLTAVALEAEVLAQEARTLSVGQQQRVALVRALLLKPPLLLLDEPTSALDEHATTLVEQLITNRAHRSGVAALISLHDPEQAERWTSRRVALTPANTGAA